MLLLDMELWESIIKIQAMYVAWRSIAREKGTEKENWLNLSSMQLPPTCLTRSEPWWAQDTDRWRKNAFELWKLYCSLPPTLLWSYKCVVRDLTWERAVTMSSCWGNPSKDISWAFLEESSTVKFQAKADSHLSPFLAGTKSSEQGR